MWGKQMNFEQSYIVYKGLITCKLAIHLYTGGNGTFRQNIELRKQITEIQVACPLDYPLKSIATIAIISNALIFICNF
jgi:hypothetical protein